jgi:hypothetical protein
MADALHLTCPACRREVHVDQPGESLSVPCPLCGAAIPILDLDRSEPVSQQVTEHIPPHVPEIRDSQLPTYGDFEAGESHWTDANLKPKGGETLAVLALLIPLISMVVPATTMATSLWLGIGTVMLTTILLSIDAASMGTIDRHGNRQMTVTGLFFGMILLWIVFYPLAYFRRRHFGRPNLGPLALLVAGIFFLVPFFKDRPLDDFLGGAGHKPPACTHPDVKALVEDLIRKTPIVANVKSVSDHKEIRYDEVRNMRVGKCLVRTFQGERITVYYNVSWIGQERRSFQVQIEEAQPEPRPAK